MNTKKIITTVALVAIIALSIYWMVKIYSGGEEPIEGVSVSESLGGFDSLVSNIVTAEDPFITLLSGVESIDLNNLKLLSNPVFTEGLKDLSRPIRDLGRGRGNPFAVIGVGNLDLGDEESGVEEISSPTQAVFREEDGGLTASTSASTTETTMSSVEDETVAQ